MMMTTGNMKISPFQLMCILFLSRFFTNMTYITSIDASINCTEGIVMTLLSAVFMFVFSLPVILLLKTESGTPFYEKCGNKSPLFEKLLVIITALIYVFYIIISTARFEIFASSVMFPRSRPVMFLLFVICICAFVSYRGIETVGRASFIFVILLTVSFLFTDISLYDKFDILNLDAFNAEKFPDIIKNAFFSSSRTVEISTVPVVAGYVEGKLHKPLVKWLAVTGATLTVIMLSVSLVLGDFGYSQMFATYSLSVLAKTGVIEKLDAVISSMWILCFLAKISYMFFVCGILLEKTVPKGRVLSYTLVPAAVFVCSLAVSYSVLTFEKTVLSPVTSVMFVVVTVVFPVCILLFKHRKKIKGQ